LHYNAGRRQGFCISLLPNNAIGWKCFCLANGSNNAIAINGALNVVSLNYTTGW
jgi:hypothetical protein